MNRITPLMHVVSAFSLLLCVAVVLSGQVPKSSKRSKPAESSQTARSKTSVENAHPDKNAQVVNNAVPCYGKNGLTPASITEILNIHNQARARLKLENLVWDCDLAAYAQEWATRGVAEHRADCFFGESIFVGGGVDVSPGLGVQRWLNEGTAWDNKNAVCQTGKTCTHYTQVMWKKTTKIGCGLSRDLPGPWKMMLVCNYDPAGNTAGPAY